MQTVQQPDKTAVPTTSAVAFFLRIYWMIPGNLLVLVLAAGVAFNLFNAWLLTNIFYWITVISLIVTRYIDIRFYHGQTADSLPATMAFWRHYTFMVLILTVLLWALCFSLNYFFIHSF